MRVVLVLIIHLIALFTASLSFARAEPAAKPARALDQRSQLLLVLSSDWTSADAIAARYVRGAAGEWRRVGRIMNVVLGRSGLGWGLGFHPPTARAATDPIKREGDGKAPAGAFELGTAFGYAGGPADPGWLWPYRPSSAKSRCVDDSSSSFYNRIVEIDEASPMDWSSAEEMVRTDDLYRWGLEVRHNPAPARPRAGSCIFLHIKSPRGNPTAGCTAFDADDLLELLGWLDPASRPALVQLPVGVYSMVRREWGLP